MERLLERILNIIGNDAFPDEDKPYIIREVVSAWNESGWKSSEQVPGANETWYDEKHLEEQKEAAYNKGYSTGHVEGYNKGLSEFKDKWSTHSEAYTNGYNLGKDERSGYDYANGHADGYSKGLEEGKKWCEEQLKAAQDKYAVAQAKFVNSDNRLGALQANYTELEKKYEEAKKACKEMYVARDENGEIWQFPSKPKLQHERGKYVNGDLRVKCSETNTFGLTLEPLECVKVIIDPLNQSYRVEKVPVREDGYYAAVSATSKDVTWILQSKNDVWYYYHGSKMHDVDNLKIGAKPIPAEYLP